MKLRIEKETKDERYTLRMTKKERALLESRAKLFGVNLGTWLVYCGQNYMPSGHELSDETPKKKKGKS